MLQLFDNLSKEELAYRHFLLLVKTYLADFPEKR
jgi:hypothetical protein